MSHPCFSYDVGGSFIGYLIRTYGLGFYKTLLRDHASTSSVAVLDDAIRQAGGAGLNEALRQWSASIALLPEGATPLSPTHYGYPQALFSLSDVNVAGGSLAFTVPFVNGSSYAQIRSLPGTVPLTLAAYASYPVARSNLGSSYSETVTVPPQSALTLVIQ